MTGVGLSTNLVGIQLHSDKGKCVPKAPVTDMHLHYLVVIDPLPLHYLITVIRRIFLPSDLNGMVCQEMFFIMMTEPRLHCLLHYTLPYIFIYTICCALFLLFTIPPFVFCYFLPSPFCLLTCYPLSDFMD